MVPAPGIRRHDIDWLRIGATYLLFFFHAARPFDHGDWHVKSADASDGFDLFVWVIHQFHMPLFFVLAGWSLERSLAVRSVAVVRRERYARLLIPFLVGVMFLSPPQAYVEAVTQRGFDGTFLGFLPCFFTSLRCFSWHHLWFLIYLFTFTMLYLPALVSFARRPPALARAARWHLYLAILPFAVVQVALRWRWPGFQNLYDDWANFVWYSLFFVAGFVLARLPAVEDLIRRERRRCVLGFALAIAAMLPLLATLRGRIVELGPGYLLYWPLSATAGVLGVAALLGYGARLADVGGASLRYLRESALPVYVLHQGVIVVLGYWVVRLPASLGLRYVVLLTASVATTMALYEWGVRPFLPLRLALGMRADIRG